MSQDDDVFAGLDADYADGIFTELMGLEILLDADPLIYGPKRLNLKISLARKMLARCERLFLDVSQKLSQYKRALRSADLLLDLGKKHLLANDPEVRAGRAVSERDAIATGKLKVEVQAVHNNQHAVEDLEAVLAVVKAKRSDLRDTQGRLRDQIRLCQEEIGLNGRWGSKSYRPTELEPGQGFADGKDIQDVDDLIQEVRDVTEAETHLTAEVDDTDDDDEVEADIAGAETPDAQPEPPEHDAQPEPPHPADEPDPQLISGEDLAEEFGFVPHCEVCGEMQSRAVGSGMICPNGHGGADSVPPEETTTLAPDGDDEPAAATVLPGTVDDDDVSNFLSDTTSDPEPALSRREIEDADEELDIESILLNFKGS